MPIKLSSKEYRVIGIAVLVAGVSLAIGVKYFSKAFPEASIEFRVTREDSTPLAQKFLAERGFAIAGYRHAAIFDYDDSAKVYLERTQGLERMEKLTRGPIHLWRWSHRWFKPLQKEEFRAEVSPAGQVVEFDHEVPEEAPGANLDTAAARAISEKFLVEVMKRDLGDLEFVETETEKRPARTDHTFTWKQKSVDLGDGNLRVSVEVAGDQVADYREFVKVPEQWSRDYEKLRSRNLAAQIVDQIFWVFLTVAGVMILIARLRDRDVPVRLALGLAFVGSALYFLSKLNTFSLEEFGYRTTDSYASFLTGFLGVSLLLALGVGAWLFFLVASSEPVYREGFPGLISFRRYLSRQGLRTRSFLVANVVGISLTFFFFAYQTVFYLAANKLGAWAPADVNYSDLLRTRFPWVFVLFMGFLPAVTEEMQFRAFAIPFFRKYLSRLGKVVAVVLAAFIWGFLHSGYPNQPFFIRGVEVGIGGVIVGFVMLRFGILATLIWHYSVDALYGAFLLLRSSNPYLMVSGGAAAGVMLLPLLVAAIAYWRTGTFTEEEPLTNASEGVSRPARAAAIEPEAAIAYQPLARKLLVLAVVLAAVFVAVAVVPVHRLGEGFKVRTTRQEVMRVADDYLKQLRADPQTYHRVAWIDPNVDSLAVEYLQERKSIAETDQIYRQATRLALWKTRYFRPLEKEEYLVYIDPTDGKVFGYRHLLDENAPGASLTSEQARELAARAVEQYGYRLADFELQNSEAEKKKAREDYTLTWQAKPGDPRNVGEAHYRLEVEIAGDQVVGFSRSFKLPETWERERETSHVLNTALSAIPYLVAAGLIAAGLILFVKQVRAGAIPWRRAAKIGALIAVAFFLDVANGFPLFERSYATSMPLGIFRVVIAVSILLLPLLAGLGCWLLGGLVASLYPSVWGVGHTSARKLWRRDAAVATALALVAGAGLDRASAWLDSRFHAYAPVRMDLFPGILNTLWPGPGAFLSALTTSVALALAAGLVVYVVRWGWVRRAWWLWVAGPLVLLSLGSADAHSLAEFMVGWSMEFVALAVAIVLVVLFFRDNVLAYFGAAFGMQAARPLLALWSEPANFYRLNAFLLAVLVAVVLGWMFLPRVATTPNERPPEQ